MESHVLLFRWNSNAPRESPSGTLLPQRHTGRDTSMLRMFQQGTIFRVESADYFGASSNSLKRNESYGLLFGPRPAI